MSRDPLHYIYIIEGKGSAPLDQWGYHPEFCRSIANTRRFIHELRQMGWANRFRVVRYQRRSVIR